MYNKNTKWQIFECGALCESGGGAKETVIWYFVDASVLRLPLLINIKSFVYFFAAAYRKTNWMFDVIWFVVENYAHSEASVINGYAILLTRSYRLHCIFFKYLALSSDFDLLFVPFYTFNFFLFRSPQCFDISLISISTTMSVTCACFRLSVVKSK